MEYVPFAGEIENC